MRCDDGPHNVTAYSQHAMSSKSMNPPPGPPPGPAPCDRASSDQHSAHFKSLDGREEANNLMWMCLRACACVRAIFSRLGTATCPESTHDTRQNGQKDAC